MNLFSLYDQNFFVIFLVLSHCGLAKFIKKHVEKKNMDKHVQIHESKFTESWKYLLENVYI